MILDCKEILIARNRNKKRCNVYYYEAMGNIARSLGFTASEFAFGCMALAMKAMKRDMPYLKNDDELILNKLRVCISSNH
jgi:hypothetical protein